MKRLVCVGLAQILWMIALAWTTGAADHAAAAEADRPLTQNELFDGQRLLDVRIEIAPEDWKN